MNGRIDLHVHSCASDGSDRPEELIRKAAELGLQGIALTDHDTVSGLPEFLSAAKEYGIRAVPGVEISTRQYTKELHIVGLFIDPESEVLLKLLEEMRSGRETRNRAILERLAIMGYDISYQELVDIAGGESIGRPHIAALLLKKGYFTEAREAFERCLKRGCRAFVPRELPSPERAIQVLHEAGGLAIWAHPVSGQSGERTFARKMIRQLLPFGLDGIEVRYSMFSEHQTKMMEGFAEEFHLLKSGGSDYHGLNQLGIELGTGKGDLAVPVEFFDAMQERKYNRE